LSATRPVARAAQSEQSLAYGADQSIGFEQHLVATLHEQHMRLILAFVPNTSTAGGPPSPVMPRGSVSPELPCGQFTLGCC
jgi:hypothetical protein